MNIIYALVAGGALAGIASFAIWIALREARQAGASGVLADIKEEEADHAQKQSAVIAEHREPSDVAKRLRDGAF